LSANQFHDCNPKGITPNGTRLGKNPRGATRRSPSVIIPELLPVGSSHTAPIVYAAIHACVSQLSNHIYSNAAQTA